MMATSDRSGSAEEQGALWGARADDWATLCEDTGRPLFNRVLDAARIVRGTRLLDVGCGSGLFCSLAAARDAVVHGIDASPQMIAIAKKRVLAADLRDGEMEALPYADAAFDVVTALNSVSLAARPEVALREIRRVTRPGGRVVVATWGPPERCDLSTFLEGLRKILNPPPGALGPFGLAPGGGLPALFEQVGLRIVTTQDVRCPFLFPDEATAVRALLAPGVCAAAIRAVGEPRVVETILGSIAPYETAEGTVALDNTFRFALLERTS